MKPVVSNRLMQFSLLALLLAACGRESTPFTLENVEQSSSHSCTSYYLDDWDGDGIVDTRTGTGCIYGGGDPFRHGKACNVLFADGHLRTVQFREWLAETTAWDPYQ